MSANKRSWGKSASDSGGGGRTSTQPPDLRRILYAKTQERERLLVELNVKTRELYNWTTNIPLRILLDQLQDQTKQKKSTNETATKEYDDRVKEIGTRKTKIKDCEQTILFETQMIQEANINLMRNRALITELKNQITHLEGRIQVLDNNKELITSIEETKLRIENEIDSLGHEIENLEREISSQQGLSPLPPNHAGVHPSLGRGASPQPFHPIGSFASVISSPQPLSGASGRRGREWGAGPPAHVQLLTGGEGGSGSNNVSSSLDGIDWDDLDRI